MCDGKGKKVTPDIVYIALHFVLLPHSQLCRPTILVPFALWLLALASRPPQVLRLQPFQRLQMLPRSILAPPAPPRSSPVLTSKPASRFTRM